MEDKKGLGDIVENVIKKVVPKLAKRKSGCRPCAKRKARLNKIKL